jgi:hypothetical protein
MEFQRGGEIWGDVAWVLRAAVGADKRVSAPH